MPADTKQKTITIPPRIIIREFAARLQLPVTQVMAELIRNGIMSSQNEEIDFDTASIIAQDFGYATEQRTDASEEGPTFVIDQWVKEENVKTLKPRPPVVVVLGHVDHGKTMLLDTIRKTKVIETEAGGITQAIGAYQAVHKDRPVTFIDTPGHEAFSAMRSRGARVADVAILVVAADDGVKPQTKEAIDILNAAALPFVVAINKIDKPDANPDKVKKDLAALNLNPEEWGGSIVMVPISAKANTNINELLDAVLLVAEVEKGKMVANPKGKLLGTIIESHVDPGEGAIATVLVHNGTLRAGDTVRAGDAFGKVKALKDSFGKIVKEAPPSFPVRILGLKGVPKVGDNLIVAQDLKELKKKAKKHSPSETMAAPVIPEAAPTEEEHTTQTLNLVLRADRLGSLEAIQDALGKLKHEDVKITIIQHGLGNVTEADVLRADTSKALLLAFGSAITPAAEAVAKGRDLTMKTFSVIYDLIDYVKEQAEALLAPEVIETMFGRLIVLAIFRTENASMVVGGRVEEGKVVAGSKVRVLRKGTEVSQGTISQLQHNKTQAKEVAEGQEAGIKYQGSPVIAVGDNLISYQIEEHKRTIG